MQQAFGVWRVKLEKWGTIIPFRGYGLLPPLFSLFPKLSIFNFCLIKTYAFMGTLFSIFNFQLLASSATGLHAAIGRLS